MTIGIVGLKKGMTRIYKDDGSAVPVTVIEVLPNLVSQIKTVENEGYSAVQIAFGSKKTSKLNKSQIGHYAKAELNAAASLTEFRVESSSDYALGAEIKVDLFQADQYVDVTAVSKGKGFAGNVKRWNFSMQDATHGNSLSHRAPGSIGQCQTPGRVFKGKKMAGHMGAEQVTTQNLQVVKVDAERNLLLIKGAVPGAPGGKVVVRPAVKKCINA